VRLFGSLSYPKSKVLSLNKLQYSTNAPDLNQTTIIVSTKHTKFIKSSKSPINISITTYMKFDILYRNVFLTEQDLPPVSEEEPAVADMTGEEPAPEGDGIPMPDNYDVEPGPVAQPAGDAGSIKNYIMKLDEFADSLNGVDSGSLQQMVTDMDRAGSLFQGISRETSSDIIKLAEQTRQLAEILKGFIINSAKRQRDIAAGQG
jgi:hypothetical protein